MCIYILLHSSDSLNQAITCFFYHLLFEVGIFIYSRAKSLPFQLSQHMRSSWLLPYSRLKWTMTCKRTSMQVIAKLSCLKDSPSLIDLLSHNVSSTLPTMH